MQIGEARSFLDKKFKKLRQCRGWLMRSNNGDSIHKFRILVKEMRAILRLLSLELENPDDLKFPKRFKDIYRHCGSIRELQLQLKVSEPYKAYTLLLAEELREKQKQLSQFLKRDFFSRTEKRIDQELPDRLHTGTATRFIGNKLNEIRKWRQLPDLSDTNIHSIRKNLKDINYSEEADKERIFLPGITKELEKAADHLGKYNDLRTCLKYLRSQWLNELPVKEKQILTTVREEYRTRKAVMKIDLQKKITTLRLPHIPVRRH